MRVVVTAGEMREIDRWAIEEIGVPGMLLMENAGLGVVAAVEELAACGQERRVLVFCGRGNNGGDGMVAARHLRNRGFQVEVYLLGEASEVRGDARVNLRILPGFGLEARTLREKRELQRIRRGGIVVDALLGTGISGPVRGFTADVIAWINRARMPVVSVDLPSGLNGDDGTFVTCVHADVTATMAALKRGLLLPPGREMAGDVRVVDIGSPVPAAGEQHLRTRLLEAGDVAAALPDRPASAHKGMFGKVALLAGSPGYTGAATLAAFGCLRAGAGLAMLGVPRELNAVLEGKATEVMTRPLPETEEGTLSGQAEGGIDELAAWADVFAVGPGLSTNGETAELVRRIVGKTRLPVVLDADGLNAFAGRARLLEKGRGRRVLTPHCGELARIIGSSIEEICRDRIEVARTWAARFDSILVLKGSPTVVAEPGGRLFINPTGNSGMATAGSGDVLTGMIAGLLGQGCSPLDAAICGVYLHGLAGDIAAESLGGRALIAGDLLGTVGEAFGRITGSV